MTVEEEYAIGQSWFNLVCAILQRAQQDALYSLPARVYLLSDAGGELMEAAGLDVEATRARLVSCWMRREMARIVGLGTIPRDAGPIDNFPAYVKIGDRTDGRN